MSDDLVKRLRQKGVAPSPSDVFEAAARIKKLERQERDFMRLTEMLDEHPSWYKGPCCCALCRYQRRAR